MIDVLSLVTGLTRAWTATYTLGLVAAVKEGRRSEIEGDLWDQQRLAHMEGEQPLHTAGHILNRFLLGISGDIAWRAETGLATRKERTGQMTETPASRLGFLGGIFLALLPIAFGGIHLAEGPTNVEGEPAAAWIIWSTVMILIGAAMVAGLLLIRRTYGRGMALVAIGVVVFCIITWMPFITVPIGIALLVLAHLRGRASQVPQSAGTA